MSIAEKLEMARRELLDLTLRNPLLNHRLFKAKGVEIVDELPEELYRILVTEGKTMTFLPAEEKVEVEVEEPEEENLKEIQDSYSDLKIQTNYNEKELQNRLLQTYLSARTFIEEQGVNILFLVMGMLRWKDSASSDKWLRAPLLLVPVELNRSNARSRFTLNYTGEEIRANRSLHAKLKGEFNIDIPLLDESDDFSIAKYLDSVAQAVDSQPSWEVCSKDMALGFFSYSKFLMFNDLDTSRWQQEEAPFSNSILSSLLSDGFREPDSDIGDDEHIDKIIEPQDTFHVVEADSSQILAMRDINRGRNLVVQGPPGTGKSQTITNIIAEAIGRGKKVLFVAEKMAALEVVKRRLDNIGLGDACLELHSNKTNKKVVLGELERVLELGKPKLEEYDDQLEKLTRSRNSLNNYCEAVNKPIGASDITPFEAYGELLRLGKVFSKHGINPPKINTKKIELLKRSEFDRKLDLVKEVKAHIKNMGTPRNHPYWCSKLESFLPTERPHFEEAFNNLYFSYDEFIDSIDELSGYMKMDSTQDYQGLSQLILTLDRVRKAPELNGVNIVSTCWQEEAFVMNAVFEAGIRFKRVREKYDGILMEESWSQEVFSTRQTIAPYRDKWWKFLSGEYRAANKRFLGLLKNSMKLSVEEKVEILDAILEAKREEKVIEEHIDLAKLLFTHNWKGVRSEWEKLRTINEYMINVYADLRKPVEDNSFSSVISLNKAVITPEIFDLLQMPFDKKVLNTLINKAIEKLESFVVNMDSAIAIIDLESDKRFDGRIPVQAATFEKLGVIVRGWKDNVGLLQQIIVYNDFIRRLKENGLEGMAKLIENWEFGGELADEVLLHEWFSKLLEKAFKERKILSTFEGGTHEHEIERFCTLDENLLKINRIRLAHEHWQRIPKTSSGEGQLGVLLWEFQKKSRHLPIRQLLSKAGNVIQAIKPVMMMSPLSIANFIEPGSLQFDLVIFDEASQVRPVDAFGAIMRGKQVVVVGDSHQMPPTSFFDYVTGANEDEENYVGDVESILALFAAQGAPQRMLKWHYRSRHESLIMVSNKEFYKNKLIVFPNSEVNISSSGLKYKYLPNTSYDRGGSRTNIKEARIVAQQVMKHAKRHPELTLGVAAFSVSQAQAIYDQLEILRRADASGEEYFKAHPEEPFFVKNLENVQGDERDVIFISVGYGRTEDGHLSMDFGPLNKEGGERRLNVLITRARQRCEVFTNLKPEDIDLKRSSARGVECLKNFLMYARDRRMGVSEETETVSTSLFEEEIYWSLTEKGYIVKKKIGSAGFYIDLAVVDPYNPAQYLLGIECDGKTYESARSARDRDRLRQKALKDKGWKLYRIWSTDWFRDPERELSKLISLVEDMKESYDIIGIEVQAEEDDRKDEVVIERVELSENIEDNKVPQYSLSELEGLTPDVLYYPEDTSKYIVDIVKTESPVHIHEVLRRIASASGTKRLGSVIQEKFETALDLAEHSGHMYRKGEFLWSSDMKEPVLRNRQGLPAALRKLEYISEEEVMLAVRTVIALSYGMEAHSVPTAACRLMGFSRVTEEMSMRVNEVIGKLETEKVLVRHGENLVLSEF